MKYLTFSILGYLLVLPVALCGSGLGQSAEASPVRPATENRSSGRSAYQYLIGERVRASLSEGCALYFGIVTSVKDDKLGFSVDQVLSEYERVKTISELDYTKPRADFRINSEARSPWDFVDTTAGRRLFVSQCQSDHTQNSYKIVVSDAKYFKSIQNVIEFDARLGRSSGLLLELPGILNAQKDVIFAGYAITLLRGGSVPNRDNRAIVLGMILESQKVPPTGSALARISLRQLLIKEEESSVSASTRDSIIRRLVELASRDHQVNEQVFTLFLELTDKTELDISSFLSQSNRANFVSNYLEYIKNKGSQLGRVKFERKLGITVR